MQPPPITTPTKAQLRARRIFTSHDLCSFGSGTVFISFRGKGKAASRRRSAWQVHGVGFKTDPTAEFLDYGAKTFEVPARNQKITVLRHAQAWAAEHYGIRQWIRDSFGGWQDAAALMTAIERMGLSGRTDHDASANQ